MGRTVFEDVHPSSDSAGIPYTSQDECISYDMSLSTPSTFAAIQPFFLLSLSEITSEHVIPAAYSLIVPSGKSDINQRHHNLSLLVRTC